MSNNMRYASEGQEGIALVEHLDSTRGHDDARISVLTGMTPHSSTRKRESITIGEAGTFKSAALARRWVNSGRRNQLRESTSRRNVMDNDSSMINESTSLISGRSAPGDLKEKKGGEQPPVYDIPAALKDIVMGKSVSVFLLLIPLAIMSHYLHWGGKSSSFS